MRCRQPILALILAAGCLARPAAAAPPEPTGSCRAVGEYIRSINAGRPGEIAGLFAEDALYYSYRAPEPLRGPAAIAGFYQALLADGGQQIRALSYVSDARHCVVELEMRSPEAGSDRFELVSVDHF